jgi:2-(1,2-epoxy-1,2-dihydrophenyl)acetyl-CoA isomerase
MLSASQGRFLFLSFSSPFASLHMAYQTLLISTSDNVLSIALHRPEVYNACNAQMATELQAALSDAAVDDTVRCIVLTGQGKAFCSGQDLKELNDPRSIDFTATVRARYIPIISAMRDIPKPIIAGINGPAAGAGLSLALGCDMRVMAASARLVEGFTGIALVPDAGGTYFYTKLMGYARAFEFVALNEPINADEALRLGLVSHMIPDADFTEGLHTLAKHVAAQPTKTLGLAKKLLQKAITATLDEMLEAEALAQQEAGTSEDFLNGVTAFLTKQQPVFRGK